MRPLPRLLGDLQRLDVELLPPGDFVAGLVRYDGDDRRSRRFGAPFQFDLRAVPPIPVQLMLPIA